MLLGISVGPPPLEEHSWVAHDHAKVAGIVHVARIRLSEQIPRPGTQEWNFEQPSLGTFWLGYQMRNIAGEDSFARDNRELRTPPVGRSKREQIVAVVTGARLNRPARRQAPPERVGRRTTGDRSV